MKVIKITDKSFTLELERLQEAKLSTSGKLMVLATSSGFKSFADKDGKQYQISYNIIQRI